MIATSLTTTLGGVGTTVMVVTIMDKSNNKKAAADKEKAERFAEIYLRSNSDNLKQELAVAEGFVVNDLAASLEISKENRKHFASLLKKERAKLLSLADPELLTPRRAGDFLRTVAKLAEQDNTLKTEIMAFRKRHNI